MSGGPAAQRTEDDLLAACPRCGYALRGLPIEHRCPECGLEFDRRWVCFGGRNMPESTLAFERPLRMFFLGILIWAGLALVVALTIAPRGGKIYLAAALVVVVVPAYFVWRRPRSFLAIGPAGITIYVNARDRRMIPWGRLGRARHGIRRKAVVVVVDGGDTYVAQDAFFGLNMAEMDRFIREFNRYPRPPSAPSVDARSELNRS